MICSTEQNRLLVWLTNEMLTVLPAKSKLLDLAPHLVGCDRLLGAQFNCFFLKPQEYTLLDLQTFMNLVIAARAWIVLDDTLRDGDLPKETYTLEITRNHFEKCCISLLGTLIDDNDNAENFVRMKITELEATYHSLHLYQIPPDGDLIFKKCSLLSLPFYALANYIGSTQAQRRLKWASDILFLLQLADDWFDMDEDAERPWCGNLLTWQPKDLSSANTLYNEPVLGQVYAKAIIDVIARNLRNEVSGECEMLAKWFDVVRTKLGIIDSVRCANIVRKLFRSQIPVGYSVPSINPCFRLSLLEPLINFIPYDSSFRAEKLHSETTIDSLS